MNFHFSKENLNPQQALLQRVLEIVPGLVSWLVLSGLVFLSIFFPVWAAIFIVAFDISWIMRILYSTIFLLFSWYRLNIERDTDWMARIKGIDDLKNYLATIQSLKTAGNWRQKASYKIHIDQLTTLYKNKTPPPLSNNIYHLIILPIIKEGRDILIPVVEAIKNQNFPLKKIVLVFALEERALSDVHQAVRELERKYKHIFFGCFTVIHPAISEGEARVKGANATCAARWAYRFFQKNNIPLEDVIISCFDADTVVSPNYFPCLTYHFMVSPNRYRASFQPIPVYHNN
ncbi:MAG: hypothetical protein HQL13_06455, partial [Candidatus Omnitrophica bacterium]|nr:hypothetical protein [Candidatus Omnitrophota bacterium]